MAKFNFGIDPDKLKEDQFLQLISWGSIPAEYMYRDAIKNNQIKLRKLSKHIKTAEESGIIFSNHLKHLKWGLRRPWACIFLSILVLNLYKFYFPL